VKDCNVY